MRKKNKTNAFFRSVTLQMLAATLYSFKITDLFSFVKAKKNPMDFIKVFACSVNSKDVWCKARVAWVTDDQRGINYSLQ